MKKENCDIEHGRPSASDTLKTPFLGQNQPKMGLNQLKTSQL